MIYDTTSLLYGTFITHKIAKIMQDADNNVARALTETAKAAHEYLIAVQARQAMDSIAGHSSV